MSHKDRKGNCEPSAEDLLLPTSLQLDTLLECSGYNKETSDHPRYKEQSRGNSAPAHPLKQQGQQPHRNRSRHTSASEDKKKFAHMGACPRFESLHDLVLPKSHTLNHIGSDIYVNRYLFNDFVAFTLPWPH